jgi:DNA-binding MurR/RpiR family transcriptional regulator
MVETSQVRQNILDVFESFSPKQRQLARFFLNNEDIIAFASAHEVGERAGTSAATVVRFCRALGYEGYTDLQASVRTQFPQYRTTVQKMADRLASSDRAENLPVRVAQVNTHCVQETLSQVSDQTLTGAVDAIIRAEKILIFGSGLSTAAAVLAEFSLTTLGFPAQACLGSRASQTLKVSQLTEGDLVIVITIWRYLRDTVEAARAAHDAGAVCIVLTDSPVAPVATFADHVFVAITEGAGHSRSLSGILALIELIGVTIAIQRPQESMEALQRVDELYRQNEMLMGA